MLRNGLKALTRRVPAGSSTEPHGQRTASSIFGTWTEDTLSVLMILGISAGLMLIYYVASGMLLDAALFVDH